MSALRTILILILSATALCSCKTEPIDVHPAGAGGNAGGGGNGSGAGGNGGGANPADTALCFERDILPIFISNCAKSGCHDAASRQDGYVFTSYQTITSKKFKAGNARETELYEKITENDPDDIMPPRPNPRLSSGQIALIGRWIDEGATNTRGCRPLCDSNRFAFSADIQPILNTYCRGCHNAAAPSAGIALDSYIGARSVTLNGRLYGAISHNTGFSAMPKGTAKLDDCTISRVRSWIQAGAPNN